MKRISFNHKESSKMRLLLSAVIVFCFAFVSVDLSAQSEVTSDPSQAVSSLRLEIKALADQAPALPQADQFFTYFKVDYFTTIAQVIEGGNYSSVDNVVFESITKVGPVDEPISPQVQGGSGGVIVAAYQKVAITTMPLDSDEVADAYYSDKIDPKMKSAIQEAIAVMNR